MPSVFISHSSRDRESVERDIISPLRAHGIDTWYSTDDIETASEWERQIREGLTKCEWFLVVLSPQSVESEWVRREAHWAVMKRMGKIVPVMLETCEPEDLHLGLLPIQYIDFRDNREQALERLLAVWERDKASQIKSLYDAARDFAAKEDWASAIEKLEAVLRLDSTQTKAPAELEHVRRQEYLASKYKDGVAAVREKRWRDAFATLRPLREFDGGYKDAEELIALARDELAKEEADQLFRQGLEMTERHDWTKAVESFEEVLKISPSHESARSGLRRALQQKEAAELYAEGRAHMEAKRWSEALTKFRRVRSIDRGYKDVSEQIADADAALAGEEEWNRNKPVIVRRKKEAAEPQQQRPVQNAATAVHVPLASKNKAPEKISVASVSHARKFTLPPWKRLLKATGFSALTILTIGLAILLIYGLVQDFRAYRHNSQGAELFNQQKYAEAEVLFRMAVEAKPSDADYRNNLARSLFQQSKFGDAELQFRKAVELSPDTAMYHDRVGEVLRWQKKFTDAEAECSKAIELDANYASYHFTLANVLNDQKKYPEAEAEYHKAVELAPNEIIYHNSLAGNLSNQKKYAAAEAEYRKVVQLNPNEADYHNELGNSLFMQQRYKDAETQFRNAVDLSNNSKEYHYNLGASLRAQNRAEEAATEYRRALEIDPNYDKAKAALQGN